ncbi:hypothetical protein [Flavimarina sp. Hel_I_48]|uniref:ORC-CDC6 family AAA ATPase n=1 Tax=Flavimarina sp. Hel_I_48 TaxID=1392488 RepID=UPI0004DF6ACB|nr:hypothetical protein [Flavimarina sp. Hel_I_48]
MSEFYSSYNARHLEPKEVAKTFIWSKNYDDLIQNNHSVILGARGCGKTTLMKMLTLPALYAWENEKAKSLKSGFGFYAVYISTDIYWNVKNLAYLKQLEKFGSFSDRISRFSVTSSIFLAICETFKNIIEYELSSEGEQKEIELSLELAKIWKLEIKIPQLDFVKEAINIRIDTFNQFIQNALFNYNSEEEIHYDSLLFLNLNYSSSANLAFEIFERIYSVSGKKWALCFDELELAPGWLQEDLFRSLRSTNQKLLFKLSASPILSIKEQELSATSGNDLSLISMWDAPDNNSFARELILNELNKKLGDNYSLEEFFGTNDVYNRSNKDTYQENSRFINLMSELAQKDISFNNFLRKNSLNPSKPTPISSSQKDTLHRKVKSIVYFRNYYIKNVFLDEDIDQLKVNLRPRKSDTLYSGIEVLCKICDGNPRWLKGILNSLLGGELKMKPSEEMQSLVLHTVAKRFMNVISNIPIDNFSGTTLETLIYKIGNKFQDEILGPKFLLDPKGTFRVDESEVAVPKEIVNLLEKAAYQGAIILVDNNEDAFDFSVRGKRFRLTYLLAPIFKLPLRTFNELKLSECFVKNNLSGDQMSIFD